MKQNTIKIHSEFIYAWLDPRKNGIYEFKSINQTFEYEPIYIGKSRTNTKTPRERQHLSDLKGNRHVNKLLQRKFNKVKILGLELIFIKILNNLNESEATESEINYINSIGRICDKTGPLYNFTIGGEGIVGYIFTEEHKRKIGNANKNRIVSNETREKLSKLSKGRKLSEITKTKLSENRKGDKNPRFGKIVSEETKLKMSKANSGGNNAFYGKSHSDSSRSKMRESAKNRDNSNKCKTYRVINPSGEEIICKGLREICLKNNLKRSALHRVATGERNQYKQWKCYYL